MKKKLLVGSIAFLAALVVGIVGVVNFRGADAAAYVTSPAEIADIERTVMATGTIQPARVVNVGAQTSGQIISMNVKLGDHVARGDVIAVIEASRIENEIRRAETQIRQAAARLNSARNNLALHESNLEREMILTERGIGTPLKLDQARNQVANATASVTQRENDLRIQELNLEAARNRLEQANIRAPMDGVVAEVVAREGQMINTNREAPTIVKLAKTDVMKVRAQVSEADIIHVQPGQPVYFSVLGDPSKRYEATLLTREFTPAGGSLDPNNGGRAVSAIYYNVIFEVQNPDRLLMPGMTAEVRVVLDKAQDVLTIPAAALTERADDQGYMVSVLGEDGDVEARHVTVGLINSALVEVREGLEPGDQVVVGQPDTGQGPSRDGMFDSLPQT